MINIEDKTNCCGCWACKNVCPKSCISMVEDEEGFCYPDVDTNLCVNCHLCENVCPQLEPELNDDSLPTSFIVQNKNKEILRKSTSGGFFSAICDWAIKNQGVVFGAAFDDHMVLRHQCATSIVECEKFRGSKYVQSLIGESFVLAKKYLDENKLVVFSGTPCQISGLKSFLRKDYDNLVTVDLVCHGVPSPLVLKDYLGYYSAVFNSKVCSYLSRDKHYGYVYSTASMNFENGEEYHKGKESDFMLDMYFRNLISRPSCYKCHFKTINRVSDFTIFDCWNARSVSRIFSSNGSTNVFVHTKKGLHIFSDLKDNFVWMSSSASEIIHSDGIMLNNSVPRNPRRGEFFFDLNSMSFEEVINKWTTNSLRSRIVSFVKPWMFKIGFFQFYMNIKNILR